MIDIYRVTIIDFCIKVFLQYLPYAFCSVWALQSILLSILPIRLTLLPHLLILLLLPPLHSLLHPLP
jgi:ABC-type uncharacterized transport system permease subunit